MPLIFGETASGLMVPVLLESDGTFPLANPAWIGAAWQKNPLLLGYSGDKTEQVVDTSASAGTNALNGAVVPAGEIWIVEAIAAKDEDNAPTSVVLGVEVNALVVVLAQALTIAAAEYLTWSGAVTLSAGDKVRAWLYGVTLNDDISFYYHARRIDIDQ